MRINFSKSKKVEFDIEEWLEDFSNNPPLIVNIEENEILSKKVKSLISPSIRAFAKGEASDGKNLMRAVFEEGKIKDNQLYEKIMRLFIKEENTHSGYLKVFMQHYKIEETRKSKLDKIFRYLRSKGGIKGQVIVLSTAEIIALTYYQALRNVVDTKSMNLIANRMLSDETSHVIFQSYKLSNLNHKYSTKLFRKTIMFFSTIALWISYNDVLKKGGYSFINYFSEIFHHLNESEEIIRQIEQKKKGRYNDK